jgi:hypothetical protein
LHSGGTEHASRSERGRRGVSGGDVEGRGGIGCGDFSERIDQRKRVRLGEALSDTTRGVERGYRLVDQRQARSGVPAAHESTGCAGEPRRVGRERARDGQEARGGSR